MRVQVWNDIYLSSNGPDGKFGYVIERKTNVNVRDKDTKEVIGTNEVFNPIGYYTTIQGAIKHGLLKMKIHESSAETLKELLTDMERIENDIKSTVLI